MEGLEARELLAVMDWVAAKAVGHVSRVAPELLDLARAEEKAVAAAAQVGPQRAAPVATLQADGASRLMRDDAGRVGVRITASDVAALVPRLQAAGVRISAALPAYHLIEGFAPVASLAGLDALAPAGLLGVLGIARPVTFAGAVLSQADFTLESDRVRATAGGPDGAGVKIGVLSDSYNRRGGAAAGVASGDLPAGIQVIQEGPAGGTDEGRAMLELIHDIAPGSPLAFATAQGGEAVFAQNIRRLADPAVGNSQVIVDDVAYLSEPFFQDGLVAQAVDDVVTNRGVVYAAAAGNLADQAYESTTISFAQQNIPGLGNGFFYDFDPGAGVDTRQRVTLAGFSTVVLSFQWDDPFFTADGVDTDLDIFILNAATGQVLSAGAADNIANQTPLEFVGVANNGAAPAALDIVIQRFAGPDSQRLKYVNYGANGAPTITFNEFGTNSPTMVPHAGAAGALAVGAAPFFAQRQPQGFTSKGPTTILFNADGTRREEAEVRAKPDVMATDSTDTTFFGTDIDGNGRPNFSGTSAAAPHAAAVAALVRQANPGFTPAQVVDRLRATADRSNGNILNDVNLVGAGLINAYRAVFGDPVAATPNVVEGFEAGALAPRWEAYYFGAGRGRVTSANGPNAGTFHLVQDTLLSGSFGIQSLTESILHVDASGRDNVRLSFAQREFNDADNAMPASFVGRGAFDGVALSVDGTNWYRIVSLTGAESTNAYQVKNFNLSELAAGLGLTLGSDVRIKFQRFSATTGMAPDQGFAFDDIRVAADSVLESSQINDGGVQRSRVTSVTLTFQGQVASAPAAAFAVTRTQDGATFQVVPGAPIPLGDGRSRVVLTFAGPGVESGSLPDGDYELTIDGAQILDDAGNPVDADADGTLGGTRTLTFHRLFGDVDGDRDVDGTDFITFRQVALGLIPLPDSLDFNGNGVFDATDRANFLSRRGKKLTAGGVVFG